MEIRRSTSEWFGVFFLSVLRTGFGPFAVRDYAVAPMSSGMSETHRRKTTMSHAMNVSETRKPTAQQAMLIKLATGRKGTTRAAVRAALQYEAGAAIPVQRMLKKLERFGFELLAEYGNDRVATYFLQPVEPKIARRRTKKAA
jgi:hypothetical protein